MPLARGSVASMKFRFVHVVVVGGSRSRTVSLAERLQAFEAFVIIFPMCNRWTPD